MPDPDVALILADEFARSFRQTDLVLYAGTNLFCGAPTASRSVEPLGMMPVIGPWREKQQPNVEGLAALEAYASELVCRVFNGSFSEVRLQSCTQANLAVFSAFLLPGDTVLCLHSSDGGHPSQNADGMLRHFPVEVCRLPFDRDRQCVDDDATADMIRALSPRLVILGPSTILRSSILVRSSAAARESGAVLVVAEVAHLISAVILSQGRLDLSVEVSALLAGFDGLSFCDESAGYTREALVS